jgi:hypothetical protein
MTRLLPLLLLVGCGLPSKDHIPGPNLRTPEELLWAVERRHLDAGSVVIRTRFELDGTTHEVSASFRGDDHARISMGASLIVGDGQQWWTKDAGRRASSPGAGQNALLDIVHSGFGGLALARRGPTSWTPEETIKDLAFTENRDLRYSIDTPAGRMMHVLRIERQSLAIVERIVTLGRASIVEKWESVFDSHVPNSLFVVPEK